MELDLRPRDDELALLDANALESDRRTFEVLVALCLDAEIRHAYAARLAAIRVELVRRSRGVVAAGSLVHGALPTSCARL